MKEKGIGNCSSHSKTANATKLPRQIFPAPGAVTNCLPCDDTQHTLCQSDGTFLFVGQSSQLDVQVVLVDHDGVI